MKSKRLFTLFEIALCMAILSLTGTLLTWQAKEMVSAHQFHKSISHLLTDLRRIQIVSLSDRADIELKISKSEKGYKYQIHTDELLPHFSKKEQKLTGVKKISLGGKPLTKPVTLTLFASGQITPKRKITLHQKEESKEGYCLNLETPLYIEIARVGL